MDAIPVLTVEVLAQDGSTETQGTITCPVSQDPIEAAMQLRLYVSEALAALQSMDRRAPWTIVIDLSVDRCSGIDPAQRRWKAWLAAQGILPAIQWKKTPLAPWPPPDQTNPEKGGNCPPSTGS